MYMIECENLVKIYKTFDLEVVALQGLDLKVEQGELMAVIGNSGSGKSTLLNMLGGLDRPSAGRLFVNGKDLLAFSNKDLTRYKRDTVGFIWQNKARNLIPYLTARENVEIPLLLRGTRNRMNALQLLDAVGLHHRRNNKLEQLSGGEQQRVAIAISLANDPKLLLADEPTGSVDTKTAEQILDLFNVLNRDMGLTIVIVTHDPFLAKRVNRVVAIRDGRTSSELIRRKMYTDEATEQASKAGQLQGGAVNIDAKFEVNAANVDGDDTHEEFAVMDQSGRLQIPANFLEAIGLQDANKIKLHLEKDKIVLQGKKRGV